MSDFDAEKMAFRINGYSLFVNQRAVLKDISLTASFGQVTTLIGPNGAGKTSLLKVIAGDYAGGCKVVMSDSLHASKQSLSERAKNFAVLPQNSELQFPFSVREVVELGRIPHSSNSLTNEKIVDDVMSRLHIKSLENISYTVLSGGEKQRVQLARVFAQIWDESFLDASSSSDDATLGRKKIVVLDEPTASLDFNHQECFVQILRFLVSRGVAVVIVSHDINLSLKYTDRFIAMKDGCVFMQGAEDTVVTSEAMKKLFDIDVSVVPHPDGGRMVAF